MSLVLLTAVGEGAATIFGSLIGFAFKRISHKLSDIVLSFAAGVMLAAGVSPKKTFLCAMATGLVEVIGTLFGFLAVSVAEFILPFALAFAGGTMLYVISDEMIPETHAHGSERGATYALLAGFCVMLVSDVLLG